MSKGTQDFDPTEIVIERREIVGRVKLDTNGTELPLVAAFKIIGEYLGEHDDREGIEVSFTWMDRVFRAGIEPYDRNPLNKLRDEDYE